MRDEHIARNAEIARRYIDESATQKELGLAFKLTRSRVQQILDEYGINRKDNARWRDAQSERYASIAVNVTKVTKAQLVKCAKSNKQSVSALVNDMIEDYLRNL